MSSGSHIGISNGTSGAQGSLMQMISEQQARDNEKYIASISKGAFEETPYCIHYTQLGASILDKALMNAINRFCKSTNLKLNEKLIFVVLLEDYKGISAGTLGLVLNEYNGTSYKVKFFDSYGITIDIIRVPVKFLSFLTK